MADTPPVDDNVDDKPLIDDLPADDKPELDADGKPIDKPPAGDAKDDADLG